MWRNPALVTTAVAEQIWAIVMDTDFRSLGLNVESESDLLCKWYQAVVAKLSEGGVSFYDFSPWFHSFMVKEVTELESRRLYNYIPGICDRPVNILKSMSSSGGFNLEMQKAVFEVCRALATCVLVLLGTEGRTLVGVKNGVPVWKSAPPATGDELWHYITVAPMLAFGLVGEIDRSDEWLVPTYHEFSPNAFRSHYEDSGYTEVNAALVEEAFYNQRYVIDAEGVFVKLTNAQNVTGLYLKTKPSFVKDSLIDVFARVETVNGAFLTAFSEEWFLNSTKSSTRPGAGSYVAYLICQVYHDLVTCVDVPIAKKRRDNAATLAQGKSKSNTSWTVIPRRVKKVVREPRHKIPTPKIMEPRRVTGHLRKANMTDAHREELVKFERETGLEVLRFIPEGHTFVRPHISPKTTEKELAGLPRFIRYRIQRSLEDAMRKRDFRG